MLIANEPELALNCKIITKVWGVEYVLINSDKYCCKFLKINPGFRSSIHKHIAKDETFVGLQGTALLKIYNGSIWTASHHVSPGVKIHVRPETWHSFEAQNQAWVMEISTPHSDDDVVRSQESRNINDQQEG